MSANQAVLTLAAATVVECDSNNGAPGNMPEKPAPRKRSSKGKVQKFLLRTIDKVVGAPIRFLARIIAGWFVEMNYLVRLVVDKKAYDLKDGAIVIYNHISFLDGLLILYLAYPFAWIRPTMWYAERRRFGLKWFFTAIGAIELGSPKDMPKEEREERKAWALETMDTLLKNKWGVAISPEGTIGDGSKVEIKPHFMGTYDLIKRNPDKKIVMVTLRGLEKSRFGRGKPKAPLFQKLPVDVDVKVFDSVDISKGHEDLNRRINAYYNEGTPL